MDGFKRPHTNQSNQTQPHVDGELPPIEQPASEEPGYPLPDDISLNSDKGSVPPQSPKLPKIGLVVGVIGLILFLASFAATIWFESQLAAIDSNDKSTQKVEIKEGNGFAFVASRLEERGLIKNSLAFDLYARIMGKRNAVKAGTCVLTPSESSKEILDKITSGCHDFKSITFYPGATIEQPLYKPKGSTLKQTLYVRNILSQAGYSEAEIESALNKTYSGPLFANKPAGTTLEGYVFGETYYVDTNATAEQVLQTTFDQMYKVVQKNNLVEGYKQQGLDLFEGITLASIVQSELDCEDKKTPERKERCYQYQRTIAQIFLKRLDEGTTLGSDVTFIYAANMLKVAPMVNLDSPYNTRIKPGLTPGPVSSPGELALKSVANPTDTDYVFFIAGDDGLIYFAKTDAEHQKNIRNHCQIGCGDL